MKKLEKEFYPFCSIVENFCYFYVMNNYQKQQAIKILQSYSTNIEKGGKRAEVGEVRFTGGKMRIKHQEGWLYQRKDGSFSLVKNDGSTRIATPNEVLFAKNHIKEHDLTTGAKSSFRKKTKDVPIQRQVGKKLSLNHAIKQDADKLKSLTKHVLKITKNVVNDILINAEKTFKENGVEFKAEDRALYKIRTTYEILEGLSAYAKDTDKIINYKVTDSFDRVEADFLIERDGEEYYINSQIIPAGGYSVQTWHTRLLIKSDLPKNDKKSNIENLMEGITDNTFKTRVDELEEASKAVKEIFRIKRAPIRYAAVAERYESLKEIVDKIPNNNDKEFVFELIKSYEENKIKYSNYDSFFKDFNDTLNSILNRKAKLGRVNPKTLPMSEKLSLILEEYGDLPTGFGDDKLKQRVIYLMIGQKSWTKYAKLSIKEVFDHSIKEIHDRYLKLSKSTFEHDINEVYKTSILPFNLGKASVLDSKISYDKGNKEFSIPARYFKKVFGKGVSGNKSIRLRNKELVLFNPKTNKEELFKYNVEQKKFISTNGLKLKINF